MTKYYEVVSIEDELPSNNKLVFAFDAKGMKYDAFYIKDDNSYEVDYDDFEDDDNLPDHVKEDNGKLTLKKGWYQTCENSGYYDYITYKREIVSWLKPLPEDVVVIDKNKWKGISEEEKENRLKKIKEFNRL